jgi:uncharacterized membrane protein YeaQ/YmgE (transglycosylase-associated protein family)
MVVNVLLWCLFGLIAGVVAKLIGNERTRTDPAGIATTIVLGIAGAVLGGWISSLIFNWDVNSFSVPGFVVAVAGALVLLFLYHLVMNARKSL